ncbi:MAG: radical SAM protein [Myxococcales bacterium]
MALDDSLNGVKVSLFLNHACNLRCRYCYTGAKVHRPMSSQVARQAVDFGFEQAGSGFLLLSFFGGEPLLEVARIEEAVAYAKAEATSRKKALFFSLSTNGTLLDDRRLALIKASGIRVQFSLDGGYRAQDANRRFVNNRSSFARASLNLKRLIADGIQPRVVAVIDPRNARHLVDSWDSLRSLGATNVYFAPNLSAKWTEAAQNTFEKSLAALADRWAAGFREAKEGEPLPVLDPLNGKVLSQLLRGTKSPIRCAYGHREFAVAPSGRIYPCDRMVKEDKDESVLLGDLKRGLDLAKQKAMLERRTAVEPECAECDLRERCQNRCGCANHELTGDPARVSPVLCWYERTIIRETDRVANALFADKVPAFLRHFYRA